jgi:hypothetical protein
MSDAEYRAGVEAGEFRPLLGDHLFVTDDPDRLAGGAYGAKGGGHIVEFAPQPTSVVPSTYGGFDEIGVSSIPAAAVRRVWSWDGSDHVPATKQAVRLAALTENLASRLQGEFDAWWAENGDSVEPYRLHDEKRGPIGSWPYVEEFLRDRYPAAHRGLEMGWEEAGALLDHPDRPLPYVSRPGGADVAPYATGPAAVDEHGYDPAEVAAGMVLLHNRSMPSRAAEGPIDEARLRDIAVKRHRMQGRRCVAISDLDAYDEWYDHENPQDAAPEHQGPWYHYSPAELPPGTKLVPGGGPSPWGDLYAGNDEMGDSEARRGYVWLSPDVSSAVGWAGETPGGGGGFIYRVEPSGDVYPWNDSGAEGWVADSATVVEALPHPWREAKVLYRGLEREYDPAWDTSATDAPAGYSNWTDNADLARQYAGPRGHVYSVDLPDEAMGGSYIDDDGERPLYYLNEPRKGRNGVEGGEYLVYQDHEGWDPDAVLRLARLALRMNETAPWFKPITHEEVLDLDRRQALDGPRDPYDFTGSPETQHHHRQDFPDDGEYDIDAMYDRMHKGLPVHGSADWASLDPVWVPRRPRGRR